MDRALRVRHARPASTSRASRAGFALPLEQWSGSTIGTVPIGHGIAVTPMQMARAYAAIANGGVLVQAPSDRPDRRQACLEEAGPACRLARASPTRCCRCSAESCSRAPAPRPRSPATRSRARREPRRRSILTARYSHVALRRLVRRARPRDEAAARDHGHGRRASRELLRRRRCRARLPRDRPLQPAAPRDSAGRSAHRPRLRRLACAFSSLPASEARRADPGARAERGDRGPAGRDRRPRVRHAARDAAARSSSASAASASTATTSRGRRSSGAPSRSSSSARSTSTSRSSSSRRCARRWRSRPTCSSASRPRSSSSRASPGRTGRRRPRSCCARMLEAAGRRPGLVGTIEWRVGGERRAAPFTTPEAIDLQRLFREMLDAGDRSAAVEASSHGSAAQASRPRALRRARVHEPEPGPPRPARDDGGLLPGEAAAVHRPAAARRRP